MKIGLCINTHERPEYLSVCLDSVCRSEIPAGTEIVIVDDNSQDPLVDAMLSVSGYHVIKQPTRMGIKKSLRTGIEYLIENKCDILINLDGDAQIRNDFFPVLVYMHNKFPDRLITGFNCNTLNADGSVRHQVLSSGLGYNTKLTVGGINFCFTPDMYRAWMLPSLMEPVGNFDQKTCLNAGNGVVCTVPSVVQHLGLISAMGHTSGIEKSDTADDFKPLHLSGVTLIGVDDNIERLRRAADICCQDVSFESVKLLSCEFYNDPRVMNVRRLDSKEEYSRFIFNELVDYVDTEHMIVFQHDGYILNWKSWDPEFKLFDYIGAKWSWYQDGYNVGNGGFSFRSRRLQEILKKDPQIVLQNDGLINNLAEDHNLARIHRPYLDGVYGIKYASGSVADRFSIEAHRNPDVKYKGSFGFHGGGIVFDNVDLKHVPYYSPKQLTLTV